MTGAENNLNIFAGAPGRILDALPLFSGVSALCLPVRAETSGAATLYTLHAFDRDGRPALAAFTSPGLVAPPFSSLPLEETALLFFHAPVQDRFCFNGPHPHAQGGAAALDCSRADMSLLAGFAKLGKSAPQGDTAARAAGEFGLGNLHAAHYLAALAFARNPASRARFQLGAALIELGLLQEAYDLLKSDWDPEARFLLAVVHRRTGSPAEARKLLAALDQVAPLAEKRALESAWLDLEEGREDEAQRAFEKLSASSFEKTEALAGLGTAMARAAFKAKDKGRLSAAVSALRSALVTPSPASARVFFQLASVYFRTGDHQQAEACYRRSAALFQSVQSLANLALSLSRLKKFDEAAAVAARVALTDPVSAMRLAGEFPQDRAASLFPPAPQQPAPAPAPAPLQEERPAPPPAPAPAAAERPQAAPPPPAAATERLQAAPPPPQGGLDSAAAGFKFINPAAPPPSEMQPARPRDASVSKRTQAAAQKPAGGIKIETTYDSMAGSSQASEEESRRDDFISRAFKLASALEDEAGRKVYFNLEGLGEVERKLRLQFIKGKSNPQGNLETVKDCAAFLCYFLQERFKGRLMKLSDFDPWGWPMLFELPERKLSTYPVQRVWRMLWEPELPEPGWLAKYAQWLADRLKEEPKVFGAEAARAKLPSHPERLADAQTEHRRMLVLLASLQETSHIEIGRTGLLKLENELKKNFRPGVPPTTDGWKLLRCYGHLLAAILARDFKAVWFNVDGEDGGWSMRLPWNTMAFPLGKIYKTASNRDDLDAYYEALLAEKLRYQ